MENQYWISYNHPRFSPRRRRRAKRGDLVVLGLNRKSTVPVEPKSHKPRGGVSLTRHLTQQRPEQPQCEDDEKVKVGRDVVGGSRQVRQSAGRFLLFLTPAADAGGLFLGVAVRVDPFESKR
jgi:hypothetical protein